MSAKSDKAEKVFISRCNNCSQAVFTSFCEDYGLSKELGLKISVGFGSGIANCGEICGAVSGAILALGLKFGDSKEETYKQINIFTEKFKSKHKTLNCTELVGFHLNDEEELVKAKESGKFKILCPKLVKDSVEIVEELINAYQG